MVEDLFEQIIPIFFFALVGFIVFWAIQANGNNKKREHEERMLAIEKGVDIPMHKPKQQKVKNPYVAPFVLIGIGLAFMMTDSFSGFVDFGLESIPLVIGVALLLAHFLYEKKRKKKTEESELSGMKMGDKETTVRKRDI